MPLYFNEAHFVPIDEVKMHFVPLYFNEAYFVPIDFVKAHFVSLNQELFHEKKKRIWKSF